MLNHLLFFFKKSAFRYLSDNIMFSKQKFKTILKHILHIWLDM